jgi:hypothetical protein
MTVPAPNVAVDEEWIQYTQPGTNLQPSDLTNAAPRINLLHGAWRSHCENPQNGCIVQYPELDFAGKYLQYYPQAVLERASLLIRHEKQ